MRSTVIIIIIIIRNLYSAIMPLGGYRDAVHETVPRSKGQRSRSQGHAT